MKVEFKSSFGKDLRQIQEQSTRRRIQYTIVRIEQASNLHEIANLKKLRGEGPYYRLRVGDYRLGIRLEGETVVFVRCLHRKDMYRNFP